MAFIKCEAKVYKTKVLPNKTWNIFEKLSEYIEHFCLSVAHANVDYIDAKSELLES